MSTTPEKVKFYRGKSYNPETGGDTESRGEIVFLNDRMNDTKPEETDADALEQYNLERKLGSIWQDDKIVGTTKADELCLTDKLKVTRTDVTIGKVGQNFEFKKGMSLTEILKELFCEIYNPTYNGSYLLNNIEAISYSSTKPETKDGDTIYILPGDSTTLEVPDYMSADAWEDFSASIGVMASTDINESKCVGGSVYVTHYTKNSDGNAVGTDVPVGKYFTGPNYNTLTVTRTTSRNLNGTAKDSFANQEVTLSKGVPSSTTYTYTRTDSYAVNTPSTGTSYGVKWPADSTGGFINELTFITNNEIKDSDLNTAKEIDGYPEVPTPESKTVTFNVPSPNTFTYTYTVQSVLPVTIDGTAMGSKLGDYTGITSSSTYKKIILTTDRQWAPTKIWKFNISSYSNNGNDIDIESITSDWSAIITKGEPTFSNNKLTWEITIESAGDTIGANGQNGPTITVKFKNKTN